MPARPANRHPRPRSRRQRRSHQDPRLGHRQPGHRCRPGGLLRDHRRPAWRHTTPGWRRGHGRRLRHRCLRASATALTPPPAPPTPTTPAAPPTAAARGHTRRANAAGAVPEVRLPRPHQVRRGTGLGRAVRHPGRRRSCVPVLYALTRMARAKARRRIRFAGAVANIPPGATANVRLTAHEAGPADRACGRAQNDSGV